jgi:hypothetical protein
MAYNFENQSKEPIIFFPLDISKIIIKWHEYLRVIQAFEMRNDYIHVIELPKPQHAHMKIELTSAIFSGVTIIPFILPTRPT